MPSFLSLWSAMLDDLSAFLLSEPVIYFVGAILLLFIVAAIKKLID